MKFTALPQFLIGGIVGSIVGGLIATIVFQTEVGVIVGAALSLMNAAGLVVYAAWGKAGS